MKVSILFESESDMEYRQQLIDASEKYPMIISDVHHRWGFITDLPKNINQDQLDQLCALSFSNCDVETLVYFRQHHDIIYSNTNENKKSNYINTATQFLTPINYLILTWAQYVERCNDSYDDNDFED